jgi:predicted Zn finger-like uncharacterized protein
LLTQCPKCETIYRLDAADLAAAKGFVECGDCGEQFNALSRLADEPTSLTEPPNPDVHRSSPHPTPVSTPNGPAFVLIDSEDVADSLATVAEEETPQAPIAATVTPDLEQAALFEVTPVGAVAEYTVPEMEESTTTEEATDFEMAPVAADVTSTLADLGIGDQPAQTLSESEHAILFTDPQAEFEDDDPEDLAQIDIDDVPAILKEEIAALSRPRRTGMGRFWVVLAFVLFSSLSLQLAWVFRGQIIGANPAAQAFYL